MRPNTLLPAAFLFFGISASGDTPCDLSLMRYVHSPARLKIVEGCVTIRGTVISKYINPWDGDYHVNIRPDAEFMYLLNDADRKKGRLVTEFVCQSRFSIRRIIKKNEKQVCEGYSNFLQIPKMGDYVEMTGIHVDDVQEGHMEIHPVTNIKIIMTRKAIKAARHK